MEGRVWLHELCALSILVCHHGCLHCGPFLVDVRSETEHVGHSCTTLPNMVYLPVTNKMTSGQLSYAASDPRVPILIFRAPDISLTSCMMSFRGWRSDGIVSIHESREMAHFFADLDFAELADWARAVHELSAFDQLVLSHRQTDIFLGEVKKWNFAKLISDHWFCGAH